MLKASEFAKLFPCQTFPLYGNPFLIACPISEDDISLVSME